MVGIIQFEFILVTRLNFYTLKLVDNFKRVNSFFFLSNSLVVVAHTF